MLVDPLCHGLLRRALPWIAVAWVAGCTLAISPKRAPRIGQQAVRIPLLDPVASPMAVVLATLASADGGRRLTCPMLVDTGASRTTISATLAQELGLEIEENTSGAMRGVAGMRHRAFRAELPALRLGPLILRRVPVSVTRKVTERWGLLGNDILGQGPVQVDKEHGQLVLNASPLGKAAVHRLPFDPGGQGSGPRVNVMLDGRKLWMTLDTGASGTALDEETGAAMALPTGWYRKPREVWTPFGSYLQHGYFHVQRASWGTLKLQDLQVAPLPKLQMGGGLFDQRVVGLLGMDVLARHVFWIGPRTGIVELRPQSDPVTTTAARLRRWPQLRSCAEREPCVAATLETGTARPVTASSQSPVRFRLQSNLGDPIGWRLLFGFADHAGAMIANLPLVEVCGKVLARGKSAVGELPRKLGGVLTTKPASAAPSMMVLLDINPTRSGDQCSSPASGYHLKRAWWSTALSPPAVHSRYSDAARDAKRQGPEQGG